MKHSKYAHLPYLPQPSARFAPDTLAALRVQLPDYLSAIGFKLRRQGSRLITTCPMHDDTNPSFAVFDDDQVCGCYPCAWRGDVFAFAQWTGRAKTFPEAVRHVADVLNSPAVAVAYAPKVIRKPAAPFNLTDGDREKIRAARLRFSDAYHNGDPVIDRIAASLGMPREVLRFAAHGSDGLGLAPRRDGDSEWLCYAYSTGLKWRNPNPQAEPRFKWLIGKATAPWRMGWARNRAVKTVYLTEGESDALANIAIGLETDGTAACVASPGTSFQKEWAPMFSGKQVILCFDNDKSGQTATAKVAGMLAPYTAHVASWKGGAA